MQGNSGTPRGRGNEEAAASVCTQEMKPVGQMSPSADRRSLVTWFMSRQPGGSIISATISPGQLLPTIVPHEAGCVKIYHRVGETIARAGGSKREDRILLWAGGGSARTISGVMGNQRVLPLFSRCSHQGQHFSPDHLCDSCIAWCTLLLS